MDRTRHVAVVDIGKTNAKVALVDLSTLSQTGLRQTPNRIVSKDPYPRHDHDMLWDFILESLRSLNSKQEIEAISITTHGATAALVDASGGLVMPILDYEHTGPEETADAYDKVRPGFAETGSPRLPAGLNLGAQLFWLAGRFPDDFVRVAHILSYPQYWAYRLSGVASGEVTSLGVHTDLWNPAQRCYSSLVTRMGWQALMPPMCKAGDSLGPPLPEIVRRTGIAAECDVLCGVHDSNASLVPYLLTDTPPFSVVSTGTWVISMAVGAHRPVLDERRDTLINVNIFGDAVPSARFMGGREFTMAVGKNAPASTAADFKRILETGTMLLPSVIAGVGPYPDRESRWIGESETAGAGERAAAVSAYLALMTATCLGLIGADGPTHVEGPFAGNDIFCRVLRSATGRTVLYDDRRTTGTSLGAGLLADPSAIHKGQIGQADSANPDCDAVAAYVRRWFGLVNAA